MRLWASTSYLIFPKLLLALLSCLFFRPPCLCQDATSHIYQNGYFIKQFTEINGLVNNQCKAIFQDSKGFLWISTFQGLSRFDGRQFINYGLKQGLPGLDISQVCEDSSGFIYVATTKGIARYIGPNPKNDSCFHVYKPTTNLGSAISGMQAIDSSTIVFQRIGEGLSLLYKDRLSVLWERVSKYTRGILKDRDNIIYAYTMDTIRVYDKNLSLLRNIYFPNRGYISFSYDNGIIHACSNNKTYRVTSSGLTPLGTTPDSVAWFCNTSAGKMFYSKDRTGLSFYDGVASTPLLDLSVLPLYINDLLQARDKSLWLATNAGGIFKITRLPYQEIRTSKGGYTRNAGDRAIIATDSQLARMPSVTALYSKLKGIVIRAVFADRSGNIWFCTGNGIYKQSPGKTMEHYSFGGGEETYGPVAKEIRGVVEASNGDLWFYGYPGIIRYRDGQFKQYTTRNGLGRDILVRYLLVENTGTVLFSDYFNLSKVQGDTVLPIGKELNLPGYIPNRIKTDINGFVWIDYNKKLFKIGLQSTGSYRITDSIILPADNQDAEISKFEFDGQNNCWIAYTGGKIRVFFADKNGRYNDTNSIAYTADDGLNLVASNDYNFFPDQNGNMVIVPRKTDNEKIFVFRVADVMERKKMDLLQVTLTELYVNQKTPDWSGMGYMATPGGIPPGPRFRYKSNDFLFSYRAASPGHPAGITYQVLLKGYDKNWKSTTETSANYTNLPSGNYVFMVKTANANGEWGPVLEYPFTILLPWYKTWWAILLWILLIASIFLFLYTLRIRTIRKNETLKNLRQSNLFKSSLISLLGHDMMTPLRYIAKVALQLKTYHERISKKTTIESLNEINVTASKLQFFGESIIHWIRLQNSEFKPQVENINLYKLVNELAEFHQPQMNEKGSRIITDIPFNLHCYQDPTLIKIILHNLLVNSNKFTDNGLIEIQIKKEDHWLHMMVQDNGKGMSPEKVASLNSLKPISSGLGTQVETGWGMGYAIIIDMLKFSRGKLHVASKINEGTIVVITIPGFDPQDDDAGIEDAG